MNLIKLLICFTLASYCSAQAESIIPLNSLINEAQENNPEIKASRARWQASTMRPSQEGSLPNPMIGISWQNVSFDKITLDEIPNSMMRFPFSQEFPFPGKLSLKEKIAEEESEAMGKSYNATIRMIVSQLKQAYYDWAFIIKSIEITERNKELLKKFAKISETKYEVGNGIQQDVVKAQVEVSKLIEQLLFLNQKKEVTEAKIRSILNRSPLSPLGKPENLEEHPIDFKISEIFDLAEKNAPILEIRENIIESEEQSLNLANKEYFPDLIIGASPGIMGMREGGVEGVWEVSLGLKIPLYFWRKESFGVKQAALELNAAKSEYNAEKQSLFFKLEEQYMSIKTTEKLLRLYKNGIIPQSKLSLESAMSGYRVGDVDFLTLMDNLVTLFEFEREYFRQLTENQKSIAVLEELSGIDITNNQVSMKSNL